MCSNGNFEVIVFVPTWYNENAFLRPILHQTASVRFTIPRADNGITGIVMGTGCYWSGIDCAGRDCARYGTREQEEPGEVSPDAASSAAHVPVYHLIPIP